MKILIVLALISVSGAQTQSTTPISVRRNETLALGVIKPLAEGCAVGIGASRQVIGRVLLADAAQKRPGTRVSVVLVAPAGKLFRTAEVMVSYEASTKGLQLLAGMTRENTTEQVRSEKVPTGAPSPSWNYKKHYMLQRADGTARIEQTLALGVAGRVTEVRLLAAEYMDGTSLEAGRGCVAVPSPLVLVAGQ